MDQDYDDSDEQQESPGKGLRAQLEAALNDKKALETQLSELRGKVRQADVSSVLTAKGVNSKVAKFIPADVEGAEAIGKWLEENADVFGFTTETQEQGAPQASQEPNVPAEQVQATQRMQNLGQSASSPSKLADIEARMKSAGTAEELQALWSEAQKFIL